MIHNHHGNISRLNADNSHTNNTTNHIYLNAGSNSIEYEDWMRKIGSLLNIGAEHSAIKPVLELLVAAIEPHRIFILNNQPIETYNIKATIEVILIVNDEKSNFDFVKHFVQLACAKTHDVIISVHPSGKMEYGLRNGHIYYSTHCRENYLVFSGSMYRLFETRDDLMAEISIQATKTFYEEIGKAEGFLNLANEQENQQEHNVASLMLQQSVEQVYRGILLALNSEIPHTHRLEKLERKAAIFMPQILQTISDKQDFRSLNMAYDSQTISKFDVAEICDVRRLCDEVKILIEVTKMVFQDKQERLFLKLEANSSDEDISDTE